MAKVKIFNRARLMIINNLIYMLLDVIESFLSEIPQHVEIKRQLKMRFDPAIKSCRRLVSEVNKSISEEEQDWFEADADELKSHLEAKIDAEIERQEKTEVE